MTELNEKGQNIQTENMNNDVLRNVSTKKNSITYRINFRI